MGNLKKTTLRQTISILTLLLFSTLVFGQKTIRVQEGDKTKMIFEKGEWFFKDKLYDGHYVSYRGKDTSVIAKEVFIKNGKKNGMESRYYFESKQKYAEINWEDGRKNGVEVHYNGNGTIDHLLTFEKGELNGLCIVNWTSGAKRYKGFYENGFRYSVWTYYDQEENRMDSANYRLSEEYKYQNGKPLLLSAWNKSGRQIVANGNGNGFSNGLKNDRQVDEKEDGALENEKYYQDGLLIKEIIYYDSNKVASISEWSYPFPPKIDTNRAWIDTWITDIFYNEVTYTYKAVKNGHWIAHYPNGVKIYDGDYRDGKRIGVWTWNYKNGNARLIADYSKNTWQHSDTTGEIISGMSNEYLTLLSDDYWFLNQRLDTNTVILSRRNKQTVTPRLIFHFDGQLEINSYLECGKDIGESINSYSLLADNLSIKLTDEENKTLVTYNYKIVSANTDKIILKRQKK